MGTRSVSSSENAGSTRASDVIFPQSLILQKEKAEIANQCGFNDPNYFARIFRKRTGSAPLEFRKQER